MAIEVRSVLPEARFGVVGSVLVSHYRGRTTLAMLDELDRIQSELIAKHQRISTMSVVGQLDMLRVEDDVRKRSLELGKKFEHSVYGNAIVITTRGLAAVMARTFLTGYFLISLTEAPTRTCSTVAAGLEFLFERDPTLRGQLSLVELQQFLDATT